MAAFAATKDVAPWERRSYERLGANTTDSESLGSNNAQLCCLLVYTTPEKGMSRRFSVNGLGGRQPLRLPIAKGLPHGVQNERFTDGRCL